MFKRKFKDKRYKVISDNGFGLIFRIPRYKKTQIFIGSKADAEKKGLNPKGTDKFYVVQNGEAVVDEFLAEPAADNNVEVKVKGNTTISSSNWQETMKEIDYLLNYEE